MPALIASARSLMPTAGRCFSTKLAIMPMATQIKFAARAGNGEITRVGSNEQIKVNVRVLSATIGILKKRSPPARFAWISITGSRS